MGRHVVTLARSSIEPFLVFSTRRDLRETAFRAWLARGENGGETDNRAIINKETIALRAERARLPGFATFAHYRLADSMAKTPEAALDLLHTVWPRARRKAEADAAALQAMIAAEGGNFRLAAWDWRHYARRSGGRPEFAIPPGAVEPYLQLDRLIEAAFATANRLRHHLHRRAGAPCSTTRMSAPGTCGTRTAGISGSSSATISRGPPGAAAPG
ncbi:MAG: M3 family metallopeptidase [Geminicoccaceae bacterium]